MWAGDPGYFTKSLEQHLAVTPEQVQQAAQQFMRDDQRVVITVTPEQKQAAGGAQ
jgi:predicted Zn-dependent peptidase